MFCPAFPTDVSNGSSKVNPSGNSISAKVCPSIAINPTGTSYFGSSFSGTSSFTSIDISIPVTICICQVKNGPFYN